MKEETPRPSDVLKRMLKIRNVTAYEMCKETGLAQSRVSEILNGKRRITSETAAVLAQFFKTPVAFWVELQADYDLEWKDPNGIERREITSAPLTLGKYKFHAAVLDNEVAVVTTASFLDFFGITKGAYATGERLANIIESDNLNSKWFRDLRHAVSNPVKYINSNNCLSNGYEGTLIVDYCKGLLEARRTKEFSPNSQGARYAQQAELLVESLAKVGITALIYEATGYETKKRRDALQRLFDAYFRDAYARWTKRFPDDFYTGIMRLKHWSWDSPVWKRPPVFGKITKDIVYQRLEPGVLDKLEDINPVLDGGRRAVKHHQWLSDEVGQPDLDRHLFAVTKMMDGFQEWESYYHLINLTFPKKGSAEQLLLGDYDSRFMK